MELCNFHFVPNFEECSLGVIVNYKSPIFWKLHESWTVPISNLVHLIFEIAIKDKVIMQWAACLIYPQNHEITWNLEYVSKLCWGECYLCEFCDEVKVASIPKTNFSLINNAFVKNCQKKGDINTTTFFLKKKPLNLALETWISLHLQTVMIAKLEF
jgi:hypothetical protein